MVFGVDEAGKGPVLGSMFVAAVSGDPSQFPGDVGDSKSIPDGRRRELAAVIRDRATAVYVVEIPVERIDDPETQMNELTVAGHARAAAGVLDTGRENSEVGRHPGDGCGDSEVATDPGAEREDSEVAGNHGDAQADTEVDEILGQRAGDIGVTGIFGNNERESERTGNFDDVGASAGEDGTASPPEASSEEPPQVPVGYLDAGDTDEKRFERRVRNCLEMPATLRAEHGADERYTIVGAASIIAKEAREQHVESLAEKYGRVGSGYPSDQTTREFLETYVRENHSLPACARTSWGTSRDVLAALDQSTLTEF